jgi:hypothetical protein
MASDVAATITPFVSSCGPTRTDETDDATYSKRCYPRTPLAGCKARWTIFEEKALRSFARAAFSTVPIHLINIVIALICSNHVDK